LSMHMVPCGALHRHMCRVPSALCAAVVAADTCLVFAVAVWVHTGVSRDRCVIVDCVATLCDTVRSA